MYFNGCFRKIGDVDCSAIAQYVNDIPEASWNEHTKRQNAYKVHASTQMIPLIFDADFRHRFPTVHADFSSLSKLLEPVLQTIIQHYKSLGESISSQRKIRFNSAYFIRIILVKLIAGCKITPHTDNGYSLSRAHRIHWPIITNDAVNFCIDNERKMLGAGELWEINNRSTHSVANEGKTHRYHIIFDFVIPNEAIEDPISGSIYS